MYTDTDVSYERIKMIVLVVTYYDETQSRERELSGLELNSTVDEEE